MPLLKAYIVPHPPLIIPQIGRGEEKKIQDTIDAYENIAKDIAILKPDTIIISSPHAILYSDYFLISSGKQSKGDFSRFGAGNIKLKVDYDEKLRSRIIEVVEQNEIRAGTLGDKVKNLDHGTMIPLYFINKYYNDYQVIRVSPSGLSLIDHYDLGRLIVSTIDDSEKVIWVASGDLSHKLKADGPYGISQEGIEFDQLMQKVIINGNFLELLKLKQDFCRKAAECGLGSFCMMLGLFDGQDVISKVHSYQNTFGVGYMIAEITGKKLNPTRNFSAIYHEQEQKKLLEDRVNEDRYVSLARESLEYYVKNNQKMAKPKDLDPDLLSEKAGVFVSLHLDGRLRGCIGTISAVTACIADEIISNAISAGTRDYRFPPVKIQELARLDYSVDVLKPAEAVSSIKDLDVKRYGIIVRSGHRSGLLLPNIEGVDSVEEQIRISKMKAGIDPDEAVSIERFEVIRHH